MSDNETNINPRWGLDIKKKTESRKLLDEHLIPPLANIIDSYHDPCIRFNTSIHIHGRYLGSKKELQKQLRKDFEDDLLKVVNIKRICDQCNNEIIKNKPVYTCDKCKPIGCMELCETCYQKVLDGENVKCNHEISDLILN